MKTYNVSDRLDALLVFAKSGKDNWDRTNVVEKVSDALDPIYGCRMNLRYALMHLIGAYQEVLKEPRFQIGDHETRMRELIMSPIDGFYSVELYGAMSGDAKYTPVEFYTSMVMYLIGQLSITRVDWCRNGG